MSNFLLETTNFFKSVKPKVMCLKIYESNGDLSL